MWPGQRAPYKGPGVCSIWESVCVSKSSQCVSATWDDHTHTDTRTHNLSMRLSNQSVLFPVFLDVYKHFKISSSYRVVLVQCSTNTNFLPPLSQTNLFEHQRVWMWTGDQSHTVSTWPQRMQTSSIPYLTSYRTSSNQLMQQLSATVDSQYRHNSMHTRTHTHTHTYRKGHLL